MENIFAIRYPDLAEKLRHPDGNTLVARFPELAAQWHPTKNGELMPDQVTPGMSGKVWWICSKGHEWKASISNRSGRKDGCPYCSGRRILTGYNDLATINPELAAQWHPTRNGDLTPQSVAPGSHKKAWWICSKGHEWQAQIKSRHSSEYGCPVCSGEYKTSFPEKTVLYYIQKTFPDALSNVKRDIFPWLGGKELDIYIPSLRLAVEYDGPLHEQKRDQEKNELCKKNGVTLIRLRSNKLQYALQGSVNIHLPDESTESLAAALTELCQFISTQFGTEITVDIDINRDRFEIMELLKFQEKENSLAARFPELAAQWHPTKNGQIGPDVVTARSGKKVWWLGSCGHEWEDTIAHRSKGIGCPVCANRQVLIGYNDLATTHPELAAQWHPTKNGELTPLNVTAGSGKKIWWQCDKGHEWIRSPNGRTNGEGAGCPYCTNQKVLLGYNDLATTNPELAKEWHPTKNGELTPKMATAGSQKKVWWKCDKGHEWQAVISNRAVLGSGCLVCSQVTRMETRSKNLIQQKGTLRTSNPTLAAEWHPTRNGDLTPENFVPGSGKRVWWIGKCGHEWQSAIRNRAVLGRGCPVCGHKKTWETRRKNKAKEYENESE